MAQKVFEIDGIGPVIVAKRRGARNIRVSVNARGRIRVGLPTWLPYKAGVEFARAHQEWILAKLAHRPVVNFYDGMAVGKAHRLFFKPGISTSTQVRSNQIIITTDKQPDDPSLVDTITKACERALSSEAKILLPQRLRAIANQKGFKYSDLKIRKMTSRWGSCSSRGVITLSYLLVQLPWELIDYVIIHELVHTEHMNHGPDFWGSFEKALPGAKKMSKELRNLHPKLLIA